MKKLIACFFVGVYLLTVAGCGADEIKQARYELGTYYLGFLNYAIENNSRSITPGSAEHERLREAWWESVKDFVNGLSKKEVYRRHSLYKNNGAPPSGEAMRLLGQDLGAMMQDWAKMIF